jgi:tol-pal system protein YbgF
MMQAAGLRFAKSAAAVVLVVSSAGCFASTAQLDEVRDDVSSARAESATADSVRAVQLVQILSTLRDLEDSIGALNQRMTRLRAETQADIRGMRQTVSQIAEVSGQSEARLKELRSQIDSRIKQVPASPPPASPPADTVASSPQTTTSPQTASPAPAEEGPDAEELYRIGRDQLTRGGNSAARAALSDLLKRFPDSELAPDAQFLMGEAYSAERNVAAADSAYSIVVTKYPDSPRAPTALYKRGVLAQGARRTTTAKRLYNELIQKYPSSDEAELARERLRVMG